MPAHLTIHFPSAPAWELVLPEDGETVVGRGRECGLVVPEERVSRRHAAFAPGAAGWTVVDLGSKNGTLVDGRPLAPGRPAPLARTGPSWLSLGGIVARFELVSSPISGPISGPISRWTEGQRETQLRHLAAVLAPPRKPDPAVSLGELLSRVLASMLSLANAERGFLLLRGEDGRLQVAARSGLSWDDFRAEEFGGSVGAVERTLAIGLPVVASDVSTDASLGGRASIISSGIRALLCLPVQAFDRRIGVLYADSRRPGAAFTELDVELLEALASQAGIAVGVARLDGELRGLAERLAEAGDETRIGTLGDRLSCQVREILAVSRPARPDARPHEVPRFAIAGPPTREFTETWHGLFTPQVAGASS